MMTFTTEEIHEGFHAVLRNGERTGFHLIAENTPQGGMVWGIRAPFEAIPF